MLLQSGLLQSSNRSGKKVRCSCRPPGHTWTCETSSWRLVAKKGFLMSRRKRQHRMLLQRRMSLHQSLIRSCEALLQSIKQRLQR